MNVRRRFPKSRRGKILVMTALLIPVLFGAALVSTDTAVLVNAHAQLETVADASALGGAMVLADETRLRNATNLSALMATARTKVIAIAGQNRVLNAAPVVANNSTNLATGDIVIGYLAATDTTSSGLVTTGSQANYNSVKVVAARDATHGGQVPTFFGGAVGVGGKDVSVNSTATIQNYTIQGFKSVNSARVNLLPIVLDKTTYDAMIARTTADQYFYCPPPNPSVSAGADGVPESQLYPVGTGSPGNFGTVKIGVTNNSTATLVDQIDNGISASQMATFSGGVIQLNTSLNPPSISFGGNPGLSAGIKDALIAKIGKTVMIGIYDQVTGNGSNSSYRVVAFAAVRVMAVNFQGNPKYVVVQPALVKDTSILPGSVQPSWTRGGYVRVWLSR